MINNSKSTRTLIFVALFFIVVSTIKQGYWLVSVFGAISSIVGIVLVLREPTDSATLSVFKNKSISLIADLMAEAGTLIYQSYSPSGDKDSIQATLAVKERELTLLIETLGRQFLSKNLAEKILQTVTDLFTEARQVASETDPGKTIQANNRIIHKFSKSIELIANLRDRR